MIPSTSRQGLAQSAAAAYRADLGTRDQPFGDVDGDWITVASVLEHATLVEEPAKSELLREAISLATNIVGEAEVQRLAEREWQDRDRSASEAIVILSDKVLAAGAFHLAGALLDALIDTDSTLNVVQRGRLLTKRARVEWKMGKNDDAADRYRNIERLGRRSRSAELKVRAWIGFTVLSQIRENYEEMQRFAGRAARLAARENLPKLAREAHKGLMIAAGVRRRVDDALLHGWAVYRLSIGDSVDEADVLLNLGQVLFDAGFIDVARAAFASVVSREVAANLMLPALGGLALASAASAQDHTAEWAAREVLRVNPSTVPRFSLASALLECGIALTRIGRIATATRCRTAGSQLAREYDLSEIASKFERLDESTLPVIPRRASGLGRRAAGVARALTSMEPSRLPQHVMLAAASA